MDVKWSSIPYGYHGNCYQYLPFVLWGHDGNDVPAAGTLKQKKSGDRCRSPDMGCACKRLATRAGLQLAADDFRAGA